jgi:hypothetical protein
MITDTASRFTLKSYFQKGDTPTEAQYAKLIDLLSTVIELQAEETARIAADIVLQGQITSNDGELSALQTLLGRDALSTDLGDFTGDLLSDTSSVKVALQAIESAVESNDVDIAAATVDRGAIRSEFAAEDVRIEGLISSNDAELAALQAADVAFDTLLGLTALAIDLGTFTGSTIPDGLTVKGALQSLESAHEVHGTRLITAEGDIVTLETDTTNLATNLGIEISTTNTEVSAHDTRLATLEATTILDSFIFACSSNTGNIATGDVSVFRMPYGFTCTEVRASLITNTAPSAVSLKVFVDGTAITDQVDIAAGATTTYQVGVASTFLLGQNSSPQPIAMDSEVKVNVTAAPTGATGLKVTLVGYVGECAINVLGGSITFPITFPLGTVNTLITCTG